ncbi:uncharacterized protein BJX67DRAFT_278515 [Aspergillus lucknowensis]|uniref:Uncharacterized protein n=1 Tax=Aspergillus lucknowensis TaxID=176173 RepID=A0ABR4M0B2_9EURO
MLQEWPFPCCSTAGPSIIPDQGLDGSTEARVGPGSLLASAVAELNKGCQLQEVVIRLPSAGFLHLQVSHRQVVSSSSNPFPPVDSTRSCPSPPCRSSVVASSSSTTTPKHLPRPLFQSFCFLSVFSCRFALDIRMPFRSCDLRVPVFIQCSSFGWPRRVAVGGH